MDARGKNLLKFCGKKRFYFFFSPSTDKVSDAYNDDKTDLVGRR